MSRYREHMASDEWREIRAGILKRSDSKCEWCGELATQVHHVQYPKRYGEEHPDSLVATCDRCHKIAHGIRKVEEVKAFELVKIDGPMVGQKVSLVVDEGSAYATIENISRVLSVPKGKHGWFEHKVVMRAEVWSAPGPAPRKKNPMKSDGADIFLIEVIASSMLEYSERFDPTDPKVDGADIKFHAHVKGMIDWLLAAGSRALAALHEQKTEIALPEMSNQEILRRVFAHSDEAHGIATEARALGMDAHKRIDALETRPLLALYDTDQHVSLLMHAQTRSIPVGHCVPGKRKKTWAQEIGEWLVKHAGDYGAEPGDKIWEADSQSSPRREVNTWQRWYIDIAFEEHGLV